MHETRAAAIWRHVDHYLRRTGAKEHDFADAVAALYQQRTPLHLRGIEFHPHAAGSNPYEVMRANGQLLFRMLKPEGPTRLPVELEEAVVLSLPAPYRDECLRDLAERLGLLAAPLPAAAGAPLAQQVKSPCALLRSAADAVEKIAPMLEDGGIGPEDAALFAPALAGLSEVMGVCVTLNAQIAHAMHGVDLPPRRLRAVPAR
jgi:hypothetical protein